MNELGVKEKRRGDWICGEVIGAAIEVHRTLGPGLLESVYQRCLCHELTLRELRFEREKPLAIHYKGVSLESGYRVDLLVEELVLVELKAVDQLLPVHTAQAITYVKLSDCKAGLLINFNVPLLRDGIKRIYQP